jgi:uncharacterized protein YkwD
MMHKLAMSLILFALAAPMLCQPTLRSIQPDNIDIAYLQQLFSMKLNTHRKEKRLGVFEEDKILVTAAHDQAVFMSRYDTLTHEQNLPHKLSPSKRVQFFGGSHEMVGENCLLVPLLVPIRNKWEKSPVSISNYDQLAEQMFQQWKNSPGHYANMIKPEYEAQGLSVHYNQQENKLYAAQVFGSRPFTVEPSLQKYLKPYTIKKYDPAICDQAVKEVSGFRIANRIFVRDHKVFLFLQTIAPLKKNFTKPGDQIAIDIVFKEQFTCDGPNRLNGAAHHDGIMLKPVDFIELYKRNEDKQGRLIAYICDLPEEIKGKKFQLNTLLIRNSCLCTYDFPVEIESQEYDLINLQPYWQLTEESFTPEDFSFTHTDKITFEKSSAMIDETIREMLTHRLEGAGEYVKAIRVKAFSSIEGKLLGNKKLQEDRARQVASLLTENLNVQVVPKITTAENWDLFYKQIYRGPYSHLIYRTKDDIRRLLHDSLDNLVMQKNLAEQRYVEFEIDFAGIVDENSPGHVLFQGVKNAISNGDYKRAYKMQSKIIRQFLDEKTSLNYISNMPLDSNARDLPYTINLLAAKAINPLDSLYAEAETMRWFFKKFKDNLKAQYNYCIYAISYWNTTGDTLIRPDNLFKMVQQCAALAPVTTVNTMLLNYHLTAVKYYEYINDYPNMVANLNAIHDMFGKTTFDDKVAYKLGMYFSHYNSLDWVVELLEPYLEKNDEERFNHLYLAAGSVRYQKAYPEQYLKYLDRYRTLHRKNFDTWVDTNFQYLREDEFKKRRCSK